MNKEYGKEITTSVPIVTNGFLQVNEMKLNDDIYQLTKEEKELIIEALEIFVDEISNEIYKRNDYGKKWLFRDINIKGLYKKIKDTNNLSDKLGE